MSTEDRHLEPRTALRSAVGLAAVGVGVHLAFAAAGRRAIPITLLAFAPPVAAWRTSASGRPPASGASQGSSCGASSRTGIAFVVVFVVVQDYSHVPHERSAYELFRFDLDLYLWFVLALAGAYAAAARAGGRRALAALAAAPVARVVVPVALVFIEVWLVEPGGF